LDPGSGTEQEYIEDCQVCCRAWQVNVRYLPDGTAEVSVQPENPDVPGHCCAAPTVFLAEALVELLLLSQHLGEL